MARELPPSVAKDQLKCVDDSLDVSGPHPITNQILTTSCLDAAREIAGANVAQCMHQVRDRGVVAKSVSTTVSL
jgi:hypothetical protein